MSENYLDLNSIINNSAQAASNSPAPASTPTTTPANSTDENYFSSEPAPLTQTNSSSISNIQEEDTEYLDVIQEAHQEEIDLEEYVIQQYQEELDLAKQELELQEEKDGLVSDIFNGLKELTGLGVSKSEVANAIEKQEGIIEELKQAKIDGNFEEVYEKITGNKFDKEKLTQCQQIETRLEDISKSENPQEFQEEYEEISAKYKELSNEYLAGANELTNVLNNYADSQDNFIDKAANVAQIGGMVSMVIGGVACFVPGGQVIGAGMIKAGQMLAMAGTFGDNAVEAVDLLTNEKKFSEEKEEYSELAKETATDVALFAAGYAAGSAASKLGGKVLEATGSKALSVVTDKVTDIGLSLASDAAITGEVDLQGEGFSQLLGVLIGSATARIDGAKINTKLDAFINDKFKLNIGKTDVKVEAPKVEESEAKISNPKGSPSETELEMQRAELTNKKREFKSAMEASENSKDADIWSFEDDSDLILVESNDVYVEYSQKFSNMKNPDGSSRFSEEEVEDLIEAFKKNPIEVENLVNMKKNNGKYRFDGYEIEQLAPSMEKYPQGFETVLNVQKSNGSYRFSNPYDIERLAPIAQQYPNEVEYLLNIKNPNGYDAFDAYGISKLVSKVKDCKPEIEFLATISKENGEPRFVGIEASLLLDTAKQYPEELSILANVQNDDGTYVFNGNNIEVIAPIFKANKNQVIALTEMQKADGNYRFNGRDIEKLAPLIPEHFLEIEALAKMETENGKTRFDSSDIETLVPVAKDYLNEIEFLDNINLNFGQKAFYAKDIKLIAPTLKTNNHFELFMKELDPNFDINKKGVQSLNTDYSIKAKELQNGAGVIFEATKTNTNNENKWAFIGGSKKRPNSEVSYIDMTKKITMDENGNLLKSTEYDYSNKGHETWYYQSDSTLIINYAKLDKTDIAYQIEIKNDENGIPSEIIYTKKSKDLPGAYDTTRYTLSDYPEDFDILSAIKKGKVNQEILNNGYPEGEILSKAIANENTVTYTENYTRNNNKINRNYTSQKDASGAIIANQYFYEIKDENGEVLTSINRSWTRNNDGSTTTVINGKTYKTQFNDETMEIEITDDEGIKTSFSIEDKTLDFNRFEADDAEDMEALNYINKKYGGREGMQKAFYDFCKTLPADELLQFNKYISEFWLVNPMKSAISGKFLRVGESSSALAHELGHSLDFQTNFSRFSGEISSNQELIDIYNQEMLQFKKDYPALAQNLIEYFSQTGGGKNDTGLAELVAETNMLATNYGNEEEHLQTRSEYLVRYFPETVAKIISLIN